MAGMSMTLGAVLLSQLSLMGSTCSNGLIQNPAELPTMQPTMSKRHADKVAEVSRHKFAMMLVGDSMIQMFETPEYQSVWTRYFGLRDAVNLGYNGARTENILWNLRHGELTNQSPRVVIVQVGTNNADGENYQTQHSEKQIAGGIKAIVDLLLKELPKTKILLLRNFPVGEVPEDDERNQILDEAAELVKPIADDKRVFWCDVNKVFLTADGKMDRMMMKDDFVTPTPAGALKWVEEMEPLLGKLVTK